jgi:ATP-dependent helicase Lhr and Lhr-like helicase
MPQTPFHPVIEDWFLARFGAPTEPQRLGWPEIAAGRSTLIAAPTGSGKTLAAFLAGIDGLFRRALGGALKDEVQVVYVSPLKALSNDIHRNLDVPLLEIPQAAAAQGFLTPPLRAAVRTGDTPAGDREAMIKRPPHILVTTPESLYLLLTAERSRKILRTARTVIVDEIHALARDKRGSHLSLSLERLEALCREPPVRVGLSATQKPVEEIARFLVGARRVDAEGRPACRIVDTGHARELDLAVEVPPSELSAVCSNEQWSQIYGRVTELISSHRSTLVFVNTRRLAERVAHQLAERLGEDAVASHHGSLSRPLRLSAEERLKSGQLKAVVATASLELGIDVGFIDLVCQIGSPRSIATFLQRVGRSGHSLGVVPKGRLFALSRDELLECLALLRAVRRGRLDRVEIPRAPLDILAQQIVAAAAAEEWDEDDLYALARGAWPYRDLSRGGFDKIIAMLSDGPARGRRDGAHLHRDALHRRVKARRAARLAALTSGGAIPEAADYRVVTAEDGSLVGTVNEDFAIESLAGDVFLLGNTSWRIVSVRGGEVTVADAGGAPATIPFWLGEAPGRTPELSSEISGLREELDKRSDGGDVPAADWLKSETGADDWPARQAAHYAAAQKAAVGFVPTQKKILFERFFDESGGMQLVIHAPFGARVNRAWGLALRKRFCRTFDFELQAAADDNGVSLSIGPQHSFPLEQMFTLVKARNAEPVLVQALLAAPMFQVRWRWNATRALAVLRHRGGKKVPPPLQRFKADDLLSAVFPAQTACQENRPGDVPVPDHPLVAQTVYDCLHEAMDLDRWLALLADIEAGRVELAARDTREPSPFSHGILNANPYAFLDDAPLEERRARAVAVRRSLPLEELRDLARLDPEAVARVKAEAWPVVRDVEELHDALLSLGVLPVEEGAPWSAWFQTLSAAGRAAEVRAKAPDGGLAAFWTAAERLPLVRAAYPGAETSPPIVLPPELEKQHEPLEAAAALVRGRMECAGPVAEEELARALALAPASVRGALEMLEAEGFVLRGRFTAGAGDVAAPSEAREWCERRLLARIHRLTLDGARRKIQPVSPEDFWRFLAVHQGLAPGAQREGPAGLRETLAQLQGFEAPAAAWEADLLSGRVKEYDPDWLDGLSFSGEMAWGRLNAPRRSEEETAPVSGGGLTRVVPLSLVLREDLPWLLKTEGRGGGENAEEPSLRGDARDVLDAVRRNGAVFFTDLLAITGLIPSRLEDALSELAARGLVTADGFAAVRGVLRAARAFPGARRRPQGAASRAYARGGRWALFPGRVPAADPAERLQKWARLLLRRYGVMFRDLLEMEDAAPAWWELVSVYRRMEARGEIRGGRFVAGTAGEQYALPEAVDALRRTREDGNGAEWVVISAADPLNVTGALGAGPRVPATRGNRILFHDGRAAAFLSGGEIRFLEDFGPAAGENVARLLRLTDVPHLRDELLKELLRR